MILIPNTLVHASFSSFGLTFRIRLVGIGALLRAEDDGATKIEGIVNNGPADRQGELSLKDRVVGVDSKNDGNWVDIMFMPLDKVVEMIRGEDGVEVALKVEPAWSSVRRNSNHRDQKGRGDHER